ncbi:adventurous gliding motility protein Q [Chondromyces apiculatus DSM 436]|uniref:Adventurous gliding motility protein Q n=2 Tax=Chondromyces apiculatus TaxID=51 RepID=A0A017TH92_9BACT|nr:adventurous gliding motility protein Q [Chondromyces apiculatus DSM 436]
MIVMGAVACTAPTDEAWSEDEIEAVGSDEQALPTDGQVCLTIQRGTSGTVADSTLWQSAPTWSDHSNQRISSGTSVTGGYSRSLVHFDLGAVPSGATVLSADFTVHQLFKNGSSATVDVLRVTAPWSETTVNWGNFGGAVDPTPEASFVAVGSGGSGNRTVDLSDLVQDWVSGAVANHGVAIDAPTDLSRSEFRSSENPVTAERPSLSLCYTTCSDGIQNGEETGVDCGGSHCGACGSSGGGSFSYSASNTGSASYNTVDHPVTVAPGQWIEIGTCSLPGATASGDTYIRLYDSNGNQVASNDDACGVATYLSYAVPPGAVSGYTIRAGCYSSNSCSGTVVYAIH